MSGQLIRICYLTGAGQIGFATSKKIGSRPRRNKARRRVQAAFRINGATIHPELDYVVIIGQDAAIAPFGRIGEEVETLLLRVREKWAGESESS